MIEIVLQRKGNCYFPASEEDAEKGLIYHENKLLKAKITGALKERSYRELCCYMGSCGYIASYAFNEDMNTKRKVDHLTRIQQNFVEDVIYDHKGKRTHWIVKELNYATCDQPESHRFIAGALEAHAALVGIKDVNQYVALLREQK